MNKLLMASAALYLLGTLPASAQIIVRPAVIVPPPVYYTPAPVYVVQPAPVYGPYLYPVYFDHHRRYDWRYWHAHHWHR